jgi:hypothetical protein
MAAFAGNQLLGSVTARSDGLGGSVVVAVDSPEAHLIAWQAEALR